MTHEWKLDVGARRPDPNEMKDFNVLTFNSKAFPGTEPLVVGRGERVRIRLGNLSPMDHHPIHLHGLSFKRDRDRRRLHPRARSTPTPPCSCRWAARA
jgi:FtsP/CotA-like multicopper oxidase with cupredoxin domain